MFYLTPATEYIIAMWFVYILCICIIVNQWNNLYSKCFVLQTIFRKKNKVTSEIHVLLKSKKKVYNFDKSLLLKYLISSFIYLILLTSQLIYFVRVEEEKKNVLWSINNNIDKYIISCPQVIPKLYTWRIFLGTSKGMMKCSQPEETFWEVDW